MLDFDTMLMHVGEFGLYQKILFVFQAPFCLFVTFVSFGQLFILLYPRNYWCEQHFSCLTLNSDIPGAQRRNISFAWMNDGIFFNDPCRPNNIDRGFLETLGKFDNSSICARNRTSPCEYCDDPTFPGCGDGSRGSRDRGSNDRNSWRGKPQRLQDGTDDDSGSEENRVARQTWGRGEGTYGGQSSGGRGSSSSSGGYGDRYGSSSSGGRGNGNGNYGGNRDDSYYDRDYSSSGGGGNYYGSTTTTRRPAWSTQRPWPESGDRKPGNDNNNNQERPNKDGFSGSRPPRKGHGRNTPINSAYTGWPQPECKDKNGLINIVIGPNTLINSEAMRLRRYQSNDDYGKVMADVCTTRWNRSELPYETIVTEGNWWCWAEWYTFFAQAVFFVGAIVGGLLIGYIADTFGRVPALVMANVLGAIGGALSAVTVNIWLFSFFRFIAGMAFDNCFTMMYILVLEFCGPTYRTLVANLSIAIFYTIGTILLPVLAVTIADWRIFSLVTSIPMLLALLALFFVPESARWLLSKGRATQATKILRNFAKVNGRKVDEQVFVEFEDEATKLSKEWENMEEPSLTAAFKTPRLRRTFIFLIIFWAMIALVYDGHNRNILNLANEDLDLFWLFAIASMTEFPADILLIFTLDRLGRRWLAFGSMTLSAAFSIISAIITPELRLPFLISAIISRFWVNVAFNIGLQYAAELLPTVIRAQGVNTIHIMGYVAQIISPFVAAIGRSNPTLSLFLLGAFALTAGIVSLFLAETLGEDLPNTLEEAEAFGKNQSFWNCPICAKEVEEEEPIAPPPAAIEDRGVVLRNALRGSTRGATYRSSMISNASSAGSGNRRSRYIGMEGGITHRPEPTATETTKLRRITH